MRLLNREYCQLMDMSQRTYRKHLFFTTTNVASHLLIFATFLWLLSCEKDSQPKLPPSIQLIEQSGSISSDSTIAFGSLMTFTIKANGGSANLTNLYAIRSVPGHDASRAMDTSMNIREFTINKTFIKNIDDIENWTFVVRDKNLLSDSVSVTITKDSSSGFGPVRYLESIVMSAQNTASPGSFFSFDLGVLDLSLAFQNQELIDLLYYYYGEDENVIASPGANVESGVFEGDLENWTSRRTTRFIELDLPSEDFYAIENDSLLVVSYDEGSGKRKAKNLTPGKSFSFKTQDSKFGIFRVTEVEGAEAGTIIIDIKIQDKYNVR